MHTNYKLHEMKNRTKQETKLTGSHVLLKVSSVHILTLKKTKLYTKSTIRTKKL